MHLTQYGTVQAAEDISTVDNANAIERELSSMEP